MFTFRRLKRNDKAIEIAEAAADQGFLHKTPQKDFFGVQYLEHTSWKRTGDSRGKIKFRDDFIKFVENQPRIKVGLDTNSAPLGGLVIAFINDIDSTFIVYHIIKDPA